MSARMLMSALIFLVLCECMMLEAKLQVGFYENSCSMAELIVKQEVANAFFKDRGVAAGLIRMHFHDCFVRVLDRLKLLETGDLGYGVPTGRRDGRISLASETRSFPPPRFNVDELTQNFKNMGLTQEEMVTLSGAHTIGRSHCGSFSDRLYNFSSTTSQDPSLDPAYAAQLKQQCPQGNTDASLVVPMNSGSPTITDVGYYTDMLTNRGLFTSDRTLLTNPTTAIQVTQNARSPFLWKSKFASAIVKMGQIGVLTGTTGEIRANCRVISS